MAWYFFRHGKTIWNEAKKLQGIKDIPLSNIGIEQAYKLKESLKDTEFKAIYSSPLNRAVETAKIVTNSENIITDYRISEMSFGINEGEKYSFSPEATIEEFGETIFNLTHYPAKYIPPKDAESFESLLNRTKIFLEFLKENYDIEKDNIAIFAHGGVVHSIIYNLENRNNINTFWYPKIGNCGYLKLSKDMQMELVTLK